jgi:aerobic-type carbon monoxide dehydrogenase small subunit (CoxS/CutS family)
MVNENTFRGGEIPEITSIPSRNITRKETFMSEEEKKIPEAEEKIGLSRRQFLKDAGLVVGGASIGSLAILNACSKTTDGATVTKTITGPGGATVTVTSPAPAAATVTVTKPATTNLADVTSGPQKVKLTVNGDMYEVLVDPEETLRTCLREKLGYLSIKDMCVGYGACGTCTVIMDGRPILSCMALAIECGGKKIETAEGIAIAKHPLIEPMILNYCMQCGYCTPGFLCTSKALLDKNPNPTVDDIHEALAGNLCRCATYFQHIPAVQQAAQLLKGGK